MKDNRNEICGYSEKTLSSVLSILPTAIAREIFNIGKFRRDFPKGLSEIRLRRDSTSTATLSGEVIFLRSKARPGEFERTFDAVAEGSVYAHSAEIAEGYITVEGGVRVGICGDYDPSSRGIRQVRSLVFRLPMSASSFGDELLHEWERGDVRGMLIYSLPGCGKTSALRALAPAISKKMNLRVAVIDERREFFEEAIGCQVDVLSGYGKAKGIEIALRTLAAEVIVVDEIGSAEEAREIMRAGRGGVPVIATAHANDLCELRQREGIRELIDEGYFNRFVKLSKLGGRYFCDIERAESAEGRKPASAVFV